MLRQSGSRPDRDAGSRGAERVLVVGSGSIGELALVRGLRSVGYEPWLATWTEHSVAAASSDLEGTVRLPDVGDDYEMTCRSIVDVCDTLRPMVVIPGTEAALLALGELERLPSGIIMGAPPLETTLEATDKLAVNAAAERVGLQIPTSIVVDDAASIPAGLPFPCVAKPSRSEHRGSDRRLRHRSPFRVDSMIDLERALRDEDGKTLVQPYLEGPLRTVNGVIWDDDLVVTVHKSGARTWPSDCGPLSTATTVPRDTDLDRLVRDLLVDLSWSGMFNVQFLERDGDLLLIDVNPRPYLTLGLAVACGVNLPAIWVDLLLGRAPDLPESYDVGMRWSHARHDLLARMAAGSPPWRGAGGPRRRRRVVHAVWSWDDPRPLGVAARVFASRIVRRSWGALRRSVPSRRSAHEP